MAVLTIRALLFGVYIKAPDVWKLPRRKPAEEDHLRHIANPSRVHLASAVAGTKSWTLQRSRPAAGNERVGRIPSSLNVPSESHMS